MAAGLTGKDWKNTIVLGIAKGGVPIAAQVAHELGLKWFPILVQKISLPSNPEYAIGAISEDVTPEWSSEWNPDDLPELTPILQKAIKELKRQEQRWLGHERAKRRIRGKRVILVDDGIATGLTMKAAINFCRREGAKKVVVSTPVTTSRIKNQLSKIADEVYALESPTSLYSVSQWYQNFDQISDKQVDELLKGTTSVADGVREVLIPVSGVDLKGEVYVPPNARGVVIFTEYRPDFAKHLSGENLATVVFDLVSDNEADQRAHIFDVEFLAKRLEGATHWLSNQVGLQHLPIGYFATGSGAAAALFAASNNCEISSIVCVSARVDLASEIAYRVKCPTLLLVGENEEEVHKANEEVLDNLAHGKISIIAGAAHLLDNKRYKDIVTEYADEWFVNTLTKNQVELNLRPGALIVSEIKNHSHPITSDESFRPLLSRISSSKVVMLGASTHGTEEFYEIRRMLTEKLISDYGFNFVAVEGDWPDIHQLNDYIHRGDNVSAREIMLNFGRWPTWMWANEQTANLIESLKGKPVGFYGIDVYSLYESLDQIKKYARRLSPDVEQRILDSITLFDAFEKDEIKYAKSLAKNPELYEQEILQCLREILRLRKNETNLSEQELFDLKQNAKLIRNSQNYYRSMLSGSDSSWNARQGHMLEMLDATLRHHGQDAKAVVWAHNTHVGDYHACDLGDQGLLSFGGLAREKYGSENVSLVGLGTYEGEVLAAKAWEGEPQLFHLSRALGSTYDDYLHKACRELECPGLYLMMHGEPALAKRKGLRSIGVVYGPGSETPIKNYTNSELSKRFDSFIFINETHALKALPRQFHRGVLPETWPTGV